MTALQALRWGKTRQTPAQRARSARAKSRRNARPVWAGKTPPKSSKQARRALTARNFHWHRQRRVLAAARARQAD